LCPVDHGALRVVLLFFFSVVADHQERQTAAEDAERAIATIFLVARAGQLVLSAFMVASQRRKVKHPKIHAALLAAAIAESAWMANRLRRVGGYRDRVAMWSDTLGSAAGLVACASLLGADYGAPWMKNLVIGAAVGASGADRRKDRISGMVLLAVSEWWSAVGARGRDTHVAGLAMAASDVSNLIGLHVTSRNYVSMRRRFAALMDEATALRVEQARATSAERERGRQQQVLHQATIEVLNRIADSLDRESASRLAQQEAGRLRHVLRTKGQIPSELDRALYDVCNAVRERGLNVELVTSELVDDVGPETVLAARDAVHQATLSALEQGEAHRAVVRAVSNGNEVEITVRDHGVGYAPGELSIYEERLDHIREILKPCAGTVELWSAPGSGVRVTLRLPAEKPLSIERTLHQTAQRLPHDRFRRLPDGDDHGAVGQGHVYKRIDGGLVGAAQNQVGRFTSTDDLDIRGIGQPLQSGPQQGTVGHDVGRRSGSHSSRLAAALGDVMVRTTPFPASDTPSEEELRAEQTLRATYLVNRYFGLATGVAALLGGRQRFRSTQVAFGQVGVAVLESLWLGHQMQRRRAWPGRTSSTLDALVICATLAIGGMNTAPGDRSTWVNWAPWSLATNALAGQGMSRDDIGLDTAGSAAVIGVFGAAALSTNLAEFISNGTGLAWFFICGSVIGRQTRRSLSKLRENNEAAVQEGMRLAAANERARQLRYLHDGALQVLETVGSGRYADLKSIQVDAQQEADRLLHALSSEGLEDIALADWLSTVVRDQSTIGIDVWLELDELMELSWEVAAAFRDATTEALTNVRKHANTHRVILLVISDDRGISLTVQDFGSGFDPNVSSGFGTSESITRRMVEVGGFAVIHSQPGVGTQVNLRWPR
jgi:signal transduction histidine kinase